MLRPGIRRRFRDDLDTYYVAARLIEKLDPRSRRLRPVAVVDTLARSVAVEMDLRLEAAALSEMAELHRRRSRLPRADGGMATDRPRRADARWVDGIKLSESRRYGRPATTCRSLPAG